MRHQIRLHNHDPSLLILLRRRQNQILDRLRRLYRRVGLAKRHLRNPLFRDPRADQKLFERGDPRVLMCSPIRHIHRNGVLAPIPVVGYLMHLKDLPLIATESANGQGVHGLLEVDPRPPVVGDEGV